MNVFSPKRGFDWRVSVNVEVPCEFRVSLWGVEKMGSCFFRR